MASAENHTETRYWCADLVHVSVKENSRWKSAGVGVLEDISRSGACIQMDLPIKRGTAIRFRHPQWKSEGVVRHCEYREIGYYVGMKFADGIEWTPQAFRPKHLVNPDEMVAARLQKKSRAASAR